LAGALTALAELGEIRRQNGRIAKWQRAGRYWTYNLDEFQHMFPTAGMKILDASERLYMGYDVLVVCKRI
jgi:hypothetical protein